MNIAVIFETKYGRYATTESVLPDLGDWISLEVQDATSYAWVKVTGTISRRTWEIDQIAGHRSMICTLHVDAELISTS